TNLTPCCSDANGMIMSAGNDVTIFMPRLTASYFEGVRMSMAGPRRLSSSGVDRDAQRSNAAAGFTAAASRTAVKTAHPRIMWPPLLRPRVRASLDVSELGTDSAVGEIYGAGEADDADGKLIGGFWSNRLRDSDVQAEAVVRGRDRARPRRRLDLVHLADVG